MGSNVIAENSISLFSTSHLKIMPRAEEVWVVGVFVRGLGDPLRMLAKVEALVVEVGVVIPFWISSILLDQTDPNALPLTKSWVELC